MKIQYGSVFGNFKWNAEADIPENLVPVLCALGALQIGQRTPSSAAEKELAGYEKRPAGFKRDSIEYSEDAANVLAKHLESMKVEIGRDEKDAPIFATITAAVNVERYEGSTADVKMTDERNRYAAFMAEGRGAEVAEKVGYSGDLGDGTKENAPVGFLRALHAWAEAKRKAAIADI